MEKFRILNTETMLLVGEEYNDFVQAATEAIAWKKTLGGGRFEVVSPRWSTDEAEDGLEEPANRLAA